LSCNKNDDVNDKDGSRGRARDTAQKGALLNKLYPDDFDCYFCWCFVIVVIVPLFKYMSYSNIHNEEFIP
jgi:hypothetical protein